MKKVWENIKTYNVSCIIYLESHGLMRQERFQSGNNFIPRTPGELKGEGKYVDIEERRGGGGESNKKFQEEFFKF